MGSTLRSSRDRSASWSSRCVHSELLALATGEMVPRSRSGSAESAPAVGSASPTRDEWTPKRDIHACWRHVFHTSSAALTATLLCGLPLDRCTRVLQFAARSSGACCAGDFSRRTTAHTRGGRGIAFEPTEVAPPSNPHSAAPFVVRPCKRCRFRAAWFVLDRRWQLTAMPPRISFRERMYTLRQRLTAGNPQRMWSPVELDRPHLRHPPRWLASWCRYEFVTGRNGFSS